MKYHKYFPTQNFADFLFNKQPPRPMTTYIHAHHHQPQVYLYHSMTRKKILKKIANYCNPQNWVSHDVGKPKMSKLAKRLHYFMLAYENLNSVDINDVLFVDFNCRFSLLRPTNGRRRPTDHTPSSLLGPGRERGRGGLVSSPNPLLWII